MFDYIYNGGLSAGLPPTPPPAYPALGADIASGKVFVGNNGAWKLAMDAATPVALTTNGAIDPKTSAVYVITKAGVLAATLAAPTATTDDGVTITITSFTANAHTLTATSLLNDGVTGAPHTTATFAAFPGASLKLMAYQGKWNVISAVACPIT